MGFPKNIAVASVATVQRADYIQNVAEYSQEQGTNVVGTVNYVINRNIDALGVSPQQAVSDYKNMTSNIISKEDELEKLASQAIKENPKAVVDFKAGKENALQVLIGGVMRQTSGKADPAKVTSILKKLLVVK